MGVTHSIAFKQLGKTVSKEELMTAEERAIVIDALSEEIREMRIRQPDKDMMRYVIGLLEFRHRLMLAQLVDQAAETHRLNGIINHPPRDLTQEMAKEIT
jgi:hypothetical protein